MTWLGSHFCKAPRPKSDQVAGWREYKIYVTNLDKMMTYDEIQTERCARKGTLSIDRDNTVDEDETPDFELPENISGDDVEQSAMILGIPPEDLNCLEFSIEAVQDNEKVQLVAQHERDLGRRKSKFPSKYLQ